MRHSAHSPMNGLLAQECPATASSSADCTTATPHCSPHEATPRLPPTTRRYLSTGTWFVARCARLPRGAPVDTSALAEARDCLINVDVHGSPIPSARFMGGREAELLAGLNIHALTENYEPDRLIERLPALLKDRTAAFPRSLADAARFPTRRESGATSPQTPAINAAITGLYLALMADASLNLIGSRDRLLIEGRFAEAEIFVRALAALRPQQKVYVSNAHNDVPYGALRLINPALTPPSPLMQVEPLHVDFRAFCGRVARRSTWSGSTCISGGGGVSSGDQPSARAEHRYAGAGIHERLGFWQSATGLEGVFNETSAISARRKYNPVIAR